MSRDPAEPLRDIIQANEAIGEFLFEVNFETFSASDALTSQVYWKLSVIGEAANRALRSRPSLAEEIPHLVNLAQVRNRVIHGYDSIDNRIVWIIVQDRLPPAIVQISEWLTESDS